MSARARTALFLVVLQALFAGLPAMAWCKLGLEASARCCCDAPQEVAADAHGCCSTPRPDQDRPDEAPPEPCRCEAREAPPLLPTSAASPDLPVADAGEVSLPVCVPPRPHTVPRTVRPATRPPGPPRALNVLFQSFRI